MNVFQSNSAPFLLALIVSALGWYVGQINSDIRTTKVAVYSLDADERTPRATVMIKNVSRTQSLENITFALVCRGDVDDSKTAHNEGQFISPPPIAPIGSRLKARSSGQVAASASLAPGGRIGLRAHVADCLHPPLAFYYRPTGSDRFLLMKEKSLNGWMARNYIDSLPVIFLMMSALFAVWVILAILRWRRPHETAMADNHYDIRITFGDSGRARAAPGDADQRDGDGEGNPNSREEQC